MNENVHMRFGSRRPLWVDTRVLGAWFPGVRNPPWDLREHDVVDCLNDHLNSRYGIRKDEIEQTLHQLFGRMEYLGNSYDHRHGETRDRVAGVLFKLLDTDFRYYGGFMTKGLRHCRHAFVILAYLALEYGSPLLAEVLKNFWLYCQQGIAQNEVPVYLPEWYMAWEKIQEMMAGPGQMGLAWHRGRAPRHLALPWAGHRARSAPPRHRRSPEMRLLMPAYPSSALTSPMMSPVGYPHAGYFDEVGRLQYQQEEMNMKLDNVDGKLDVLIQNMWA
jgi:hypothetical protein